MEAQLDLGLSYGSGGRQGLRLLSLFSGCGGMDLGFEGGFSVPSACVPSDSPWIEGQVDSRRVMLRRGRFRLLFANDITPEAQRAWLQYFGRYGYTEDIYHLESIVELVRRHEAGGGVFPPEVDVVTGGFPCQDFSVAGKRGGFHSHRDHAGRLHCGDVAAEETRGKLYYWMKRVVEIVQPRVFVAENVKGLVNLADAKEVIQRDFSSAAGNGYVVLAPRVLHAADYGVPQLRERVFFIGIKKSALRPDVLQLYESGEELPEFLSPYPPSTHAYTSGVRGISPVTVREAIGHLAEPESSEDLSHRVYSRAKFMGTHCQGQREVDLDGQSPTIRSEHHGNIEFRRLSLAHGGQYGHELAQGLLERRLTPRECGLIQTFPEDYEWVIPAYAGSHRFAVSATGAYRVVGNAVPPLLAYHIARRLEAIWDRIF